MKNAIISELRRIRDAHAKKFNYDIEAIGNDLMTLEPWEEKKTYVRQGNRFVSVASLKKNRKAAVKRL